MLKISDAQLEMIKSKVKGLQERVKNAREKADEVVGVVIRTAEIGITAFGLSVIQGKTGGIEIVGVPLDLGIGVAAHVAAFMGFGGRFSQHLHNFGDGALANYLGTMGFKVGAAWKAKSLGAPSGTRGRLGDGARGQSLTDEERMAIQARS